MARDLHVERLLEKLVRAVELSLRATEASREAVQEILRRGADTGLLFVGPRQEGLEGMEITGQDRDFLRSLSIRPDPEP